MPKPQRVLVRTGAVARFHNVSAETVRRWVELGELTVIKTADGINLFDWAEVVGYVPRRRASLSPAHA